MLNQREIQDRIIVIVSNEFLTLYFYQLRYNTGLASLGIETRISIEKKLEKGPSIKIQSFGK